MFIIWYTLLNFINLIFTIIRLLLNLFKLDLTILNLLKSLITNFNKKELLSNQNLNTSLNFKNLYNEYKFFNKENASVNLCQNILINYNNSKILNGYCYFGNFYLNALQKNINLGLNSKLNLNYLNNQFKLSSLNIKFNKYKTNYAQLIKTSISNITINLVIANESVLNNVKKWVIKYSPSNFMKYINLSNFQNYTILFLRKNKVFNKGRYSRNRQYYRTGVYWCLYINIVAVIGIHFWFYKLTMNFGYLWWMLYAFIVSFILPKVLKYRLYNVCTLSNNLISNFVWLYLICYYYLQLILIKISNLVLINNLFKSNFFSNNSNLLINSISSLLYLLNSKYINLFEYNYINNYYNSNNFVLNTQNNFVRGVSNTFKI